MSSLKACLGVDLGAGSVKIVELKREKAAVRVTKSAIRELNLGPAASQEERAAAASEAVQSILKEEKIQTKQAVFSVPGQAVFVKRVRLPRTSEERLHRIINYEARQQIPFPLEQTMLEFQIFDDPSDPQVEVLMVAIKRDFIETFMKTVNACKLNPVRIGVNSLAIFNFHHFNLSSGELLGLTAPKAKATKAKADKKKGGGLKLKFGKKKKGAEEEEEETPDEDLDITEESLDAELDDDLNLDDEEFDLGDLDFGMEDVKAYLHIGASALDIVIARLGERKSLGFTRSVPVAGNEITRAIMSRTSANSFQEAEAIKREKVVITDEGEYDTHLPGANAEACEAAGTVANRIIAEVRRTLDFYVSQPDGVTVDSVVISGGSADIPNLRNHMEEKLGLMVEPGDEITTEHLIVDDAPEGGWNIFAPALGLALSGLGLSKIKVDFLPTNLKDIRQFKSKGGEVGILAACLAVSIFFGMQMGDAHVDWYRSQADYMQDQIDQNRPLRERGQAAVKEQEEVATRFEDLVNLTSWRTYWPTIYQEVIHAWKPPQVTLTDVRMSAWGQIVIRGYSPDSNLIATYANDIVNNAGDLIDVEEDAQGNTPVKIVQIPGNSVDTSGRPVDRFEIWMHTLTRKTSESVPYTEYDRERLMEQQMQNRSRPGGGMGMYGMPGGNPRGGANPYGAQMR